MINQDIKKNFKRNYVKTKALRRQAAGGRRQAVSYITKRVVISRQSRKITGLVNEWYFTWTRQQDNVANY